MCDAVFTSQNPPGTAAPFAIEPFAPLADRVKILEREPQRIHGRLAARADRPAVLACPNRDDDALVVGLEASRLVAKRLAWLHVIEDSL